MIELNGEAPEKLIRIGFKQNTKGEWYGEFTVRGDNIKEANLRLTEAKELVLNELKKLNSL